MDRETLTSTFDAALLTPEEEALGMDAWKLFDDPFQEWRFAPPVPEDEDRLHG